jgi:hypothetical protein
MPMINIVSLMEEQYCTTCNLRTSGRRPTYENLTRYLQRQSGGTTVDNPIELEIAIALGNTNNENSGWGDLLHAIEGAGKYVSLDLSECTIPNTLSLGGGSNLQNGFVSGAFTTGKTYVVSITFPYSAIIFGDILTVGVISDSNFNQFTNLKSVKGYGDVLSFAFNGCTSIVEVSFPNATIIGGAAFKGCTGLVEINEISFPNLTTINAGVNNTGAFQDCINLERVSLPKLTSIAYGSFKGCINLKRVYFPNVISLTLNGAFGNHFEECTSLTYVNMPKLPSIPNNAFLGCTSLKEVFFPAAAIVGNAAFSGNIALERVYIPLVRAINQNAFTGCDSLTNITIARGATINTTGLSTRAAAFRTYYEGTGARAAGTYTWNGSAWTGAF